MNIVILIGRLTKDPETRYSAGDQATAITRYTLAVNRSFHRDGEPEADFINIVAFGKRGEFAGKYFQKGMQVAVEGEMRTGSYTDKDGVKRYTTDIIVREQHFADSKRDGSTAPQATPAPQRGTQQQMDTFTPLADNDDDLPF